MWVPALLHLPPNSPDAKVFEDFAKKGNATTTSAPAAASGKKLQIILLTYVYVITDNRLGFM